MSQQEKRFYEFGEFRIDVTKRRLLREGEIVPLPPKVFDVLLTLAEHSGKTIEKDELMQKVWPDAVVEENNLTQNIYTLRKILGESRNDNRFIATVSGIGYRFVAEVRRVPFDDEEVAIKEKTEARILIAETLEDDDGEPLASPALPLTVASPFLPAGTAPRRIKKRVLAGLVGLAILLAAATIFAIRYRRTPHLIDAFRELTVTQLTRTGTTLRATISPDGKQVVYSVRESDRDSLWLRQLATGGTQQIVAPEETTYATLNYSRDGNYIYFVKQKPGARDYVLYKMPVIGGIATRLASGMEPFFSLSPDERRLAFVRNSETSSALIVANADGSGERQLAVRTITDEFKVPSWSPDGKIIACSTGSGEAYDTHNGVVGVSLEDGKQKPLTSKEWLWTRWVEWLGDGSGLLLTAKDVGSQPAQIWYVSYPAGEVSRITNDSKEYFSLSLTADSKTLVATQTQLLSEIWLTSLSDSSAPKKITFGTGTYADVCFAADGRIIYSSLESGNMDLWRINADGTEKRQLTFETSVDVHQAVSPDGRYIVFASDRAGSFNIWRMESDGSNPVRLTTGSGEKFPHCSPDGKWVIYNSVGANETLFSLWKVPLEGGQSVRLADQTHRAAVSPDGKHIAYFARVPGSADRNRIIVIPFPGGQSEGTFELPPDTVVVPEVHWAADSRALLYASMRRGVSDIWMQALDGTPARQLTDLKFEGRLLFDVSPDAKHLVLTRRLWTFDLLLLTTSR